MFLEIKQKQREKQASSSACQKYKKKNDTSKINLTEETHGTQPWKTGWLSIHFSLWAPKDYSKDKIKSKPSIYNCCAKYLP